MSESSGFEKLFYKYRPGGNPEQLNQALASLLQKKHIKVVGPEDLTILKATRGTAEKLEAIRDSPYESLVEFGVCSIKVISPNKLEDTREHFRDVLRKFPEYRRDELNSPDMTPGGEIPIVYVAGGNAALGNCGSFHNTLSRALRVLAFRKAKALFEKIVEKQPDPNIKATTLQVLFDRMQYRMIGQQPPAETLHRDEMDKKQIDKFDEIFGGWINLDSEDQFFSFIPGSHLCLSIADLEGGFASVEKWQKATNVPEEERKAQLAELHTHTVKFRVPPGHMIIFPQYIMHEITATVRKTVMYRQFVGWRLTRCSKSIYLKFNEKQIKQQIKRRKVETEAEAETDYYGFEEPEGSDILDEIIEKQAVPQLPGSMMPAMYAANHRMYYSSKPMKFIPNDNMTSMNLSQWSKQTFKPVVVTDGFVDRFMTSLKDYNLTMYPKYSKEEISQYKGEKLA